MAEALRRGDVHPAPLVDGQPAPNDAMGRLRRQFQRFLVSRREREEAELERRIRSLPAVSRPNTVALISPKGGVGKTTCTFLVGNLLAGHVNLRTIAVDANPDFGTLARLAPDGLRSERSVADLLCDADRFRTAAELTPYVSRLPTGLHLLGGSRDPEVAASIGPGGYGELVALLGTFYEVVLLDLGTGVEGPLVRLAVERADQIVVVTTPEWVTLSVVLEALSRTRHDHTTVVINKSMSGPAAVRELEDRFRADRPRRTVTIPFDERLATILDCGTYSVGALERQTRIAVKRLGLAVADQLV